MKVMANCELKKIFITGPIDEVAGITNVSAKRILAQIKNGHSWKGWTFDEVLEQNPADNEAMQND